MASHAFFSHVSSVTLFVAWIVAVFRKKDFQKLQKKQGCSVRREVTGEAVQGEAALLVLWWCLVMLLKPGHLPRQGWARSLFPDWLYFPRRVVKQWSR